MTQIDPPSLQLDRGDAAADNQQASVLQYADDPAASGAAEFATVTDSQGNTLFEQALPTSKEITLTVPADGKLTISTRWTEGRTQQEMNLLELNSMLKPGQNVPLSLSESTRRYGIKVPLLSEIPVLGQMFRQQGTSMARSTSPPTGPTAPPRAIRLPTNSVMYSSTIGMTTCCSTGTATGITHRSPPAAHASARC